VARWEARTQQRACLLPGKVPAAAPLCTFKTTAAHHPSAAHTSIMVRAGSEGCTHSMHFCRQEDETVAGWRSGSIKKASQESRQLWNQTPNFSMMSGAPPGQPGAKHTPARWLCT